MEASTANASPGGASTQQHSGCLAESDKEASSGTFAVPEALGHIRKNACGQNSAETGAAKAKGSSAELQGSPQPQGNASLLPPGTVDKKAGYVYEPPPWGLGGVHTATEEAIQHACGHPAFPDLVLEVIREGVVVDLIPLKGRGWWLLGSLKETAHVLYEHPFVSRRHLALQFAAKPPFNLYCIDLQSSYGTVCNGTRLKPQEPFLVYRARRASDDASSSNSADIPSPPSCGTCESSASACATEPEPREDALSEQESVFVVGGRENTRRIFVVKRRVEEPAFPFEPEEESAHAAAPLGAKQRERKSKDSRKERVPEKSAPRSVDCGKTQEGCSNGRDTPSESKPEAVGQERRRRASQASFGQQQARSGDTEIPAENAFADSGEIVEGEKGEAFLEELKKARDKRKVQSETIELNSRKFVGKQDDQDVSLDEDEEEEETPEARERRERLEANCEAMMFDEDDDFFDRSAGGEKRGSDAQKKRKKAEEEPLTEEKLERRVAALRRQLAESAAELARISEKESEQKGHGKSEASSPSEKAADDDRDADDSLDAFMKGVEQSLVSQEKQKVKEKIKTLKAELKDAKRLLAFAKA
ncbi:UNVERIFIED_CONTAM: hypothetical protein HHA_208310 [Hammondia hammondi]|eukprot:XP_008886879.1 hypothetical protein HHA_208310 [Hammondia hammondi]